MITNSRLLEIRATGISCQQRVDRGIASHLEKEFADLFQICTDKLSEYGVPEPRPLKGVPDLNFLIGK